MTAYLDVRHLQMLRAIATTGRVTDAAELLGLTPSALSHRIREAERRLGVTLFVRLHKRLRMTPAAEYLVQVADRILVDLERAEADVRRMSHGVTDVVRLAVEAYSSYHWLPHFLRHLRGIRADIDLQVMADASRNTLHHLLNRHIDLAVLPAGIAQSGTVTIPLFDDEIVFVMAPDHRHAGKDFIEAGDLEGEDHITTHLTPSPNQEFLSVMRPAESYPRWTTPIELPEAIVELVAAGLGTSMLARWAVEPTVATGRLAMARLTADGLPLKWSAVIRQEDAEDTATRAMADLLAAWCATDKLGFRRASA